MRQHVGAVREREVRDRLPGAAQHDLIYVLESLDGLVAGVGHARDLDAAIEFYGRTFGLPLAHREVNEGQGVEEAMLTIGDSCIQLLAPLAPDSTIAKFLDRSGEGIQQVAFRVTDLEQGFVKDPKVTIAQLLEGLGADATVRRFTRVKVGEE